MKEKNQRLRQDLWSEQLEKQDFHLLRRGRLREKKVREEGQEFHLAHLKLVTLLVR